MADGQCKTTALDENVKIELRDRQRDREKETRLHKFCVRLLLFGIVIAIVMSR